MRHPSSSPADENRAWPSRGMTLAGGRESGTLSLIWLGGFARFESIYASTRPGEYRDESRRRRFRTSTTIMTQTTLDEWASDPVNPEVRAHVYSLISAVRFYSCRPPQFSLSIMFSSVESVTMAHIRSATTLCCVSKISGNGSNSPMVIITGVMSLGAWLRQTLSRETCWRYSQRYRRR